MTARWLALAAVSVLAVSSPLRAEQASGLAPSTPWTLDYADDSCALRRSFGDGQAYFEMRRFSPASSLQITVASEALKARDLFAFQYRWSDEPEWREAGRLRIRLGDDLGGVIFVAGFVDVPDDLIEGGDDDLYLRSIDWRAIEREAAARTDSIEVRGTTLRGRTRGDLRLQLGNLEAPLKALNECVDELVTHWNIDVEAHKTLSRPAMPVDFAASSSMIGYPPKMVRRNMPGLVNIRLSIDEAGRVTACHIQMPLSDSEFEASSCADIQHAFEFEPALDKDGKPIASYWTTRVLFRIEP